MVNESIIKGMTRRRFVTVCLGWILGLFLLSSCGSRKMKQVSLPADFKGPKELGRIYGVKITKEESGINYTRQLLDTRLVDDKLYFYPIANTELFKNDKLKQNPGWD